VAASIVAVVLFIAVDVKSENPTLSPTAEDNNTAQKSTIKEDGNELVCPNITFSTSIGADCSKTGDNSKRNVTVTLDGVVCSCFIGGGGSLYYTWRTGSCTGTILSSTSKNVCNPTFCLPRPQTYYLVVSTGINGTGSDVSACVTVNIP
jgi:hypothetical protein